jgi:hypothetical protein
MPTADVDNNITVTTYTGIATLGTDHNTSGITPDIHLPLNKMVWGNENVSRRVSAEYPMPVDVKLFNGNSGPNFLLGITGYVSGMGSFTVGNTHTTPLWISGTGTGSDLLISGTIQGISGGTPVNITGAVNFNNTSIGMFGISGGTAIAITGGRNLSYSRDFVNTQTTITGLSLSNSLVGFTADTIRVYGSGSEQWIPSVLNYMDGSTLTQVQGSDGAINVNLINSGFTFTVNVSSTVGVTNDVGSALKIQGGSTLESPVLVRWHGTTGPLDYAPISGSVTVSSGTLSVSNTVNTNISSTSGSFATQMSSFATQMSSLSQSVGITGTITNKLTDIQNNTRSISAINDKISANGINVKVVDILKSNRLHNGVIQFSSNVVNPMTTASTLIYRTGVNIKAPVTNTSTVYIGNSDIVVNKSQAYPLDPGESIFLDCNSTNLIFCYAEIDPAKQRLIYIGS